MATDLSALGRTRFHAADDEKQPCAIAVYCMQRGARRAENAVAKDAGRTENRLDF